jgi:MFS family permease
VLLAMMFSMVVCAPLGGRISERLGARAVAVFGSATALAGVLLLPDVGRIATAADAVVPLVLMGAGLGLSSAPTQASAVSAVSSSQSGMASGALGTMRYLSGVVGIGVLGMLLRDAVPSDPAAYLDAQRSALWIFSGALLLATGASALLPGRAPRSA